MKLFTLLVFLLLTVLSATPAFATPWLPPTYREGMMDFSATFEYFTTTANYNRYGSNQSLNGLTYSDLTSNIDMSFDFEGNFVFGGGIGMAMAKATDALTDQTNTNSQITDAHLVAQYFFDFERFRLVPELRGSFTFETIQINDIYNPAPLSQEYCNTGTGGMWGIVNFGSIRGWGYVGYQYRDDNRAQLMPWNAGVLWRNRNLLLAGSFDGFQTVGNDTYTNYIPDPRFERVQYADGGSLRYYSTNPSLTEFRVTGGFAFENSTIITAGYAYTIAGQETAAGGTIFGGISFGIDMAATPGMTWDTPKKRKPQHRNNGGGNGNGNMPKAMDASPGQNGNFQPDLEQYDDSLFD